MYVGFSTASSTYTWTAVEEKLILFFLFLIDTLSVVSCDGYWIYGLMPEAYFSFQLYILTSVQQDTTLGLLVIIGCLVGLFF